MRTSQDIQSFIRWLGTCNIPDGENLNLIDSFISRLSDEDIDARRITFWGCFLFDK